MTHRLATDAGAYSTAKALRCMSQMVSAAGTGHRSHACHRAAPREPGGASIKEACAGAVEIEICSSIRHAVAVMAGMIHPAAGYAIAGFHLEDDVYPARPFEDQGRCDLLSNFEGIAI